jgi:HEPN domain
MPVPSAINAVVHEWVTKAESGLRAAAYLLEPREDRPIDAVCFHAQQCAENISRLCSCSVPPTSRRPTISAN